MFRQILKYLTYSWPCWSRSAPRRMRGAVVLPSQCRLPKFYSPQGRGSLSAFCALVKYKSRSLNLSSNFSTMRSQLWDSLITTPRRRMRLEGLTERSFCSTVLAHLRSIRLKVSKVLTACGSKRRRLFLLIRSKYLSQPSAKKDQSYGSVGTQETQPTQLTNYSTVRSPHLTRFIKK